MKTSSQQKYLTNYMNYLHAYINWHHAKKAHPDQTGKFPHKSTHGNQYLFTLYDYDSNAIFSIPLKTRGNKEIASAFTECHKKLTRHGHAVNFLCWTMNVQKT